MRPTLARYIVKKILSMDFFIEWDVECVDGHHHILAQYKSQQGTPIKLFLDDRHIANIGTQNNNRAITNTIQFNFSCGGETLTLVIYGSKIDLVQRGIMLKTQIPYLPKENISPKNLALFKAVTFAPMPISILVVYLLLGVAQWPSIAGIGIFTFVMSVGFAFLEERASEDIFFSKRKKYVVCWAFAFCNWLFAILSTLASILAPLI